MGQGKQAKILNTKQEAAVLRSLARQVGRSHSSTFCEQVL